MKMNAQSQPDPIAELGRQARQARRARRPVLAGHAHVALLPAAPGGMRQQPTPYRRDRGGVAHVEVEVAGALARVQRPSASPYHFGSLIGQVSRLGSRVRSGSAYEGLRAHLACHLVSPSNSDRSMRHLAIFPFEPTSMMM